MNAGTPQRSSLPAAAAWMVIVSLLLFFLPAINGVIGGAVGGYKAGDVKRGLGAAVIPAIVVALGLWLLFALFDAPVIGLLSGVAVGVWALVSSLGLLIGAAIGGFAADARSGARQHA